MNNNERPSPSWSLKTDSVNEYAYWIDAFSQEECEKIIQIGSFYNLYKGTAEGDTKKEFRDAYVGFLSPENHTYWLYEKLTSYVNSLNDDFFKFDLWGFAENLQFTEYKSPGGKYDAHIDKTVNKQIRKLSIVLQLTDESQYSGGELQLLNAGESKPVKLNRKQGTLLAFPSYTLHRVTPMIEGTRHSLVGWITGPNFK
jgi:PKHD-type hydroxylase